MHLFYWKRGCMLALAAVAALALPLSAQQSYTLQGQVVDATTQQPLPSVQVILRGTSAGALTNAEGRYTITARAPGRVPLRSGDDPVPRGGQRPVPDGAASGDRAGHL